MAPDEEVRRLLALSMRGSNRTSRGSLERAWSLDMLLMSLEEANLIIDHLIETGWLSPTGDALEVAPGLGRPRTPLGWVPDLNAIRATQGPADPLKAPEVIQRATSDQVEAIEAEPSPAPVMSVAPPHADPRVRAERRLTRFIARSSGLDEAEVERRARRKIRALGPVTRWMALALVARDQAVDMTDIVEALSV